MWIWLSLLSLGWAGENNKDKDAKDETTEEEESEPTIAESIEEWNHFAGLFDIYQDPETGDVKMVIEVEDLDKEYIHFAQTREGVLEAGHFRGSYQGERVFKIQKSFDKIEFVLQNTSFYFDPNSPLSKSKDANISPSVLASIEIDVMDSDEEGNPTRYLIEANDLFLDETFIEVKHVRSRGEGFALGGLSSSKTKYVSVKNYPDNSDFVVDYVFEDSHPSAYGSDAVTDARNVTIQMHHSIIAMPNNDYTPRLDDYRIGYFTNRVTDQTTSEPSVNRDLINRWHLVKKDPEADLSDPVEPIVWWMETTTPVQFREAIKAGAESWNLAFEAAGFTNAIEVRMQPEDADWDAGDIHHNVLRWTASPYPPFGGYGPSFSNPRTGQLLGADIMLEWIYVNNRYKYQDIYLPGKSSEGTMESKDAHFCDFPQFLSENLHLGLQSLEARGAGNAEVNDLIEQSIKHLVLHEVGHTLGLNHNMKASQTVSLENLHNLEWTNKHGLVGSVMDYTPINLAPKGTPQGKYFADAPGVYDVWAIQFGYDPSIEGEARTEHLKRSMDPLLTFGNDADDMRSPGKAMDPRVNVGDLSGDTLEWGTQRLDLINSTLSTLPEFSLREDESFQRLVNNFYSLLGQKSSVGGILSRYIGGVYVERGTTDQFVKIKPYTPVSKADQKEAMRLLSQYFFAPDAFDQELALLPYLQTERRGYDFFYGTEEPKVLLSIEGIQYRILAHLLHPTVLDRIESSALYGNEYPIDLMFTDLNQAIFMGDLRGSLHPHRLHLQALYVDMLLEIMENKESAYSATAVAMAHGSLRSIQSWLAFSGGGDAIARQHRAALKNTILMAFDE